MTMMNKFGQRYRCLLPQTGLDDDTGSDNLSSMAAGLTINLIFPVCFLKRLIEIPWGLIYNPHKERGRICIVIYLSCSFQLFPCLEIGPLTLILGCKKPTEYNLVNDQTWRLVQVRPVTPKAEKRGRPLLPRVFQLKTSKLCCNRWPRSLVSSEQKTGGVTNSATEKQWGSFILKVPTT